MTAEEQARGEQEILEMEKGGARRLQAEDAQERGHDYDEDMESDDMEGESPAIKAIEQDEPASQAAVDRMKSEKLEQVVIIIRAREDPNHTSYLYGFEDDLMIRQNNARKISDAIFSYQALRSTTGRDRRENRSMPEKRHGNARLAAEHVARWSTRTQHGGRR